MRAFVFSGGANRGSLQAGALQALIERGITPDLIVGSSVGAINGVMLATHLNRASAYQMIERWKTVRCEDIFPGNAANSVWRLVRGYGSLHSNRALRRFILSLLPHNVRRFEDLACPTFVTATRYDTGELHIFGEDPRDRLLDALLASCAVPPYLPPHRYRDQWYIDGGFASNLPISVAIQRGATEIWALEIGVDGAAYPSQLGVRATLSRSVEALMRQQMARERELVRLAQHAGVEVHHIQMLHYSGIDVHDFRHSASLIELGYQSTCTYLRESQQLPTATMPSKATARRQLRAAIAATLQVQRQRWNLPLRNIKRPRLTRRFNARGNAPVDQADVPSAS